MLFAATMLIPIFIVRREEGLMTTGISTLWTERLGKMLQEDVTTERQCSTEFMFNRICRLTTTL
jgi:hypothetical protein